MNQGLETLSCTFPLLNSFQGVQPCSHMTHILDLICMPTNILKISLKIYGAHTLSTFKVHSGEIIQTSSKGE